MSCKNPLVFVVAKAGDDDGEDDEDEDVDEFGSSRA